MKKHTTDGQRAERRIQSGAMYNLLDTIIFNEVKLDVLGIKVDGDGGYLYYIDYTALDKEEIWVKESELTPLAEEPSKKDQKLESTQVKPSNDYKDTAPEEWRERITEDIKKIPSLQHVRIAEVYNTKKDIFYKREVVSMYKEDLVAYIQARDERAVEIIEKLKLQDWTYSGWLKQLEKVITAIRANRSERREVK